MRLGCAKHRKAEQKQSKSHSHRAKLQFALAS
jgi:hypothetical protein